MNASWKSRLPLLVVAGLAVVVLARWQPARAERQARPERQGNPEAEQAIQKQAEAFIDAFHKGDAKAVAACWTADGDYTDRTGRHLQGRAAIEKSFQDLFSEHKGLKLRINSNSLRFVTPDVAIEDGSTEVAVPDGGPPSRARYTSVHVKKDGSWYLSSVGGDSVGLPLAGGPLCLCPLESL
jgi:uncharacterized protein (TIGR02246 family)